MIQTLYWDNNPSLLFFVNELEKNLLSLLNLNFDSSDDN